MNNKLKPAIIGGVILGVLSAIPFVNFVNLCCCLWAILGGALASYLYIKASPVRARPGDGAMLGLLAGVVGGAIYIVIGITLALVLGNVIQAALISLIQGMNPSQAEMMRQQMSAQTVVGTIVRGIFSALLLVAFSTIGGLIGIPIFEKRKDDGLQPPPPPPVGGSGGGFGYGT